MTVQKLAAMADLFGGYNGSITVITPDGKEQKVEWIGLGENGVTLYTKDKPEKSNKQKWTTCNK